MNKDFLKEEMKKRKREIREAKENAAKGFKSDARMQKLLDEEAEHEDDYGTADEKKHIKFMVEKVGLHASLFG